MFEHRRDGGPTRAALAALLVLLGALATPGPASAQAEGVDCEGPASEPEPGTPGWHERDARNMFCAQQRHLDKAQHPALAGAPTGAFFFDAYRQPLRHDGSRFRYEATTVGEMDAEVYRPCAPGTCSETPDGLETVEPPYPAVAIFHGGASNKELHWWSSQPLAEAGYLVVTTDASGASHTTEEALAVLDWLEAREDVDPERVGIAGHSAGGVTASRLGQKDPRLSALVSWDRAQSSPMPDDLEIDTPALFVFADYNCQQVPVCQPEPYPAPPDPDGPGNKGEDFLRARAAGVDTMQIGLRAATHLDFVPTLLSGNRYAEIVTVYYTLAWFDRHLKGPGDPVAAADAHERLVAREFDRSADRHNISQGFFDPAQAALAGDPYGGNVPYSLENRPVPSRLSFYFDSKCFLTVPGSGERASSEDLRHEACSP